MFKKAVESKLQQRLSGADRKKLRRILKERFRNLSEPDIDALLPLKGDITVVKFQNRAHAYFVEGGYPMFFDIDGRGTEIYPTVYALWKVPELLPAFVLKGGEVSRFVIGGADLMFPGISIPAEGLPSFVVGEPWAVKVPGNAAPIAVGTTTMSSNEALKAGLRGKALRIIHLYRDTLWEAAESRYVPNSGFLEDVVLEDPAFSSSQVTDLSEDVSDISSDAQIGSNNEEVTEFRDVSDAFCQLTATSTSQSDARNDIPDQIITDMTALKVRDDCSNESNADDQYSLSVEDVDALLDRCLLQALHTTVKDKDLPIPGSIVWSSHVLPCRPTGITLDIKKSSHKKLSKWLQAKSSMGLISIKEDKHKKEVVLLSINRSHPDFMSFRPEKRQIEKVDETGYQAVDENRSYKAFDVAEVYKPSSHVNPIFISIGADTKKLYTGPEAAEIVFRYIEKENLVKPTDKTHVTLDPILCDALFKGTIKKGTTYPTEIHKKDLGPTFIGRMQAHHVVMRGGDSVVRKGSLKTIQIMTERRQGNKKVTRISGLESFLLDPEALASELQKKIACSTSLAELPGKKGYEVLVQGGVIESVAKHLVEQYGIPKKYIEVLDKTKK